MLADIAPSGLTDDLPTGIQTGLLGRPSQLLSLWSETATVDLNTRWQEDLTFASEVNYE